MCVKALYMYVMWVANKDTAQGTQCKTHIPSIGETIYKLQLYCSAQTIHKARKRSS